MVKPFGDYVAVKKMEATDKVGELFVVKTTSKVATGEVVAVGDGKVSDHTGVEIPMKVKVGDIVLYQTFSGLEFDYDGKQYFLLRQHEIVASDTKEKE